MKYRIRSKDSNIDGIIFEINDLADQTEISQAAFDAILPYVDWSWEVVEQGLTKPD